MKKKYSNNVTIKYESSAYIIKRLLEIPSVTPQFGSLIHEEKIVLNKY